MPEETQPGATETVDGGAQAEPVTTEPTTTSTEKDWKAEAEKWQAMSRETEKKAAANAKRIKEIEDSQKTAEQRQADELVALRQEAETARTEGLRWRIAATHGIPAEDAELFLTGRDEETMTAQATRLAAKLAAPAPKPELRPDLSQGPRGGGTADPAQQFADIIKQARGATR